MTEPLPTWLKQGALARYSLTGQVVRLEKIADGFVMVRGPRSNGSIQAALASLTPATIEEHILYALDAARINEIKSILPHGKDANRFRIQFLGHISPAAIDRINGIVPDVFLDAELDGDAYIITVPQSWLDQIITVDPITPALLAQAKAEANESLKEALAAAVTPTGATTDTDMLDVWVERAEQAAAVEDEDLAATARVIKELRARAEAAEELADLRQAEIDSLVSQIEGAALQAEAVAESADTSTSVVPLTGCKQVMTKRAINDADLQKYLNEGWDILHIQFGTDDILNVVFTRDQVAPAPTPSNRAAAKLIESSNPLVTFSVPAEVYAESRQPVPSVNQATTAPRNYASIAQDRVRLNTLLNDPDVTQYNFTLAVEKSNLSREERNTLISQFRTHRTGEVLAEAPRRSAHNPFKSLGEGVRS